LKGVVEKEVDGFKIEWLKLLRLDKLYIDQIKIKFIMMMCITI